MLLDITKERLKHILMGIDDNEFTIERWQAVQYERLPNYYKYYKHQGHLEKICNVKQRNDKEKKRKEVEKIKSNLELLNILN